MTEKVQGYYQEAKQTVGSTVEAAKKDFPEGYRVIYAVYPPGIRLISYLPQFADTRGNFILALNDRSRVRCCRSHSTILNNPVERNVRAERHSSPNSIPSSPYFCGSNSSAKSGAQNGYEKDQGSIGNGQEVLEK